MRAHHDDAARPIRSRRPLRLGACVLGLGLVWAAAVHAAMPQQAGTVDLLTQANVELDGAAAGDETGLSVARAGDVNGDGIDDMIVGADRAGGTGAAYVVFGGPAVTALDLAKVGAGGFRIDGAGANEFAGFSVGGAGDLNGDGLADVIVGAPAASHNNREMSGSAYVVFGASSTAAVDLGNLGDRGFRIDGAAEDDEAGVSVAGAGDVNGDGQSDVVVGADGADNDGRTDAGSAYVVFGGTSPGNVDLRNLGVGGFRIDGADPRDGLGGSVAGPRDVNGDGLADVIVGADYYGEDTWGSAYVVFGKPDHGTVDLDDLGNGGFRIDGALAGGGPGVTVAGAGDVNGDGLRDVVVGASAANNNGRTDSGSAYVVFGKTTTSTVTLNDLGAGGFRIDAAASYDGAGVSVGGGGDVNGDGRPDVIVGAPGADSDGRSAAGAAYVVFGRASTATIDLASLGSAGFRIDGAAAGDVAGGAVAAAGDVNGDARPDVIVGAPEASPNGRQGSGSAYAVYGFGVASVCYPSGVEATVGEPIEPLAPIVEHTGPTSFAIDPALPAGLELDPSTGVISGTATEPQAAAAHTVRMLDLAGTDATQLQVSAGAAAADAAAPCVEGFAVTPRRFPVARGATVRYTLSEPATATIEIRRAVRGRRGTRFVEAGTLERRSKRAGAKRTRISGGLGRGRYRATITARDAAGNRSRRLTHGFRIVAR